MLIDGVYSVDRVFTSSEWLINQVLVIENGIIISMTSLSNNIRLIDQHYSCLVPSFVDIQIYGASEKLFCEFPEVDALVRLQQHCTKGGTDYFLPTLATNTSQVFMDCIDAVREYWSEGGTGCLGLHLEGPWLSKARRGAHIETLVHQPTLQEAQALLEHGRGVIKVITIAPEECSEEVVRLVRSHGIVISAGHTDATYAQATAAFDSGHFSTATHLYNAMSGLQHRAPGVVGAIFNHASVRASIVVDGHHVDFAAVQIAKKILKERLFCITDAVTTTTTGEYSHVRVGDKYESGGILSGSALTMTDVVRNLVTHCHVELDEALRMCSLYPAQVIHMDHELGKIQVGHKAAIIEWQESW